METYLIQILDIIIKNPQYWSFFFAVFLTASVVYAVYLLTKFYIEMRELRKEGQLYRQKVESLEKRMDSVVNRFEVKEERDNGLFEAIDGKLTFIQKVLLEHFNKTNCGGE